jgi:hypothetical protein
MVSSLQVFRLNFCIPLKPRPSHLPHFFALIIINEIHKLWSSCYEFFSRFLLLLAYYIQILSSESYSETPSKYFLPLMSETSFTRIQNKRNYQFISTFGLYMNAHIHY